MLSLGSIICVLIIWILWFLFQITVNRASPPNRVVQAIIFIVLTVIAWVIGKGLDLLFEIVKEGMK